ncbi:MAG: site-specific DNA-methyltransferase [Myxococcota bacterium]
MSQSVQRLRTVLLRWLEGRAVEATPCAVVDALLPSVRRAIEQCAPAVSVPEVLDALADFLGDESLHRLPAEPWAGSACHYVGPGCFIHEDLAGVLRSRLEAFVVRRVFALDSLPGKAEATELAARAARAMALRAAGQCVFAELATYEDARRDRWLEVRPPRAERWCVSLGLLPASLRARVCDDVAQRAEWVTLLGERADLSLEALLDQPHLVVDTRHLPDDLAAAIVEGLEPEVRRSAHLAVRADNVDALRWLQRESLRVECTFIDPPYNTGSSDFDYDDSLSGRSWTAMMWERLVLARDLMADDGVLVATIDDHEVAHLRLLLERAFGARNFVTQAVWHKKYARQNDATWFSTSHDHVLIAARDKATWRPNRVPRSAEQNKGYKNPDRDPRGPWQSVVYTCAKTAEQRPNLYYPLTHPATGEPVWPKRNRVWGFGPQAHARNEREGRVWWGLDQERKTPRRKVFLCDVESGVVPDTLWTRKQVGDNQDAQRQLAALFADTARFSTPKPLGLLERVVTLGCSPHGRVLDFFAGSGTTAHAVLRLNAQPPRSPKVPANDRRFVVVERGEVFEQVLVPRIKKVGFCTEWSEGRPTTASGQLLACRVVELEPFVDPAMG